MSAIRNVYSSPNIDNMFKIRMMRYSVQETHTGWEWEICIAQNIICIHNKSLGKFRLSWQGVPFVIDNYWDGYTWGYDIKILYFAYYLSFWTKPSISKLEILHCWCENLVSTNHVVRYEEVNYRTTKVWLIPFLWTKLSR